MIKDKDLDEDVKKKQIKDIEKEMNEFIMNPDLAQDVLKHKDFIFTLNEPVKGDTIGTGEKYIPQIKIPYESPLFQMLKRGIGLYIENMPDEWLLKNYYPKSVDIVTIKHYVWY